MFRRIDPVLAVALALATLFSLYGIQWGRVECWNRDQMALRGSHGFLGLRPNDYLKPPFHTFLNHALVLKPIDRAEQLTNRISSRKVNLNEARLLGSRLLVVLMFLGTIWLAYEIARQAYGVFAARVIALLMATSAGFIEYDHFLSCDSPLLFWMLLALFFAQRITIQSRLSNYILAGLITGLATATKYNGIAVGIAIVVAHFLSASQLSIKGLFFDRRLVIGLVFVPIGFLAGNPYALFDWKKFSSDFVYGYYVTPRYEGQTGGLGYAEFLRRVPDLIGWPGAVLIALTMTLSIVIVLRRRDFRSAAAAGFVLSAAVLLVYFAKIGAFPRTQTRFVLPVIPFLLLMTGPFLQISAAKPRLLTIFLLPILFYNSVCSFFVGRRFCEDPRMDAQSWLSKNVFSGCVLESSAGAPHWEKLPGLNMREVDAGEPDHETSEDFDELDLRMPAAHGRAELFSRIFRDKAWLVDYARKREEQVDETLFTLEKLRQRNPDIVTVYSSDYEVPSVIVRNYYSDLLAGKFPYGISFDARTKEPPRWIYPRDIDFLSGRITILVRQPET